MYLLRIIQEREFDYLEEITDKYPNAVPVNEFSNYEDIYAINVNNIINKVKPKTGQLIRFTEYKCHDRCYVVLEVTQEDIDKGCNVDKPGLYGFGGMWYGRNRLNYKSYGKIVELDLKDYPWVVIYDDVRELRLKDLKKLVD